MMYLLSTTNVTC